MSTRHSKRGFLAGAVLVVLGIAVAIASVAFGAKKFVDGVRSAERHPIPATVTTPLKAGEDAVLVALAPTKADAQAVKARVTGPGGTPVPLTNDGEAPTVGEIDGRQPSIVGTFRAERSGEYTVEVTGPSAAQVSISATTARDVAPWILGGIAAGTVLGILGVLSVLLTFFRRRRRTRARA